MSIAHSTSIIASATILGDVSFASTTYGQVSADGFVMLAHGYEFNLGSPGITVDTDAGIWVIDTATSCYIRCANNANGDTQNENWYNTGGTPQGDPGAYPGTGTNIFDLGENPDSINIYTVSENTTDGTPIFNDVGTWTDDDKSTFFAPTQDVKYGKDVNCVDTSGPPPATGERGNFVMQVTFRKAGKTDLTITFSAEGRARSEWEP